MTTDDVVNEVLDMYGEWLEMMEPSDAMNLLVEQLARRVVIAREEAIKHKMALKRLEIMR